MANNFDWNKVENDPAFRFDMEHNAVVAANRSQGIMTSKVFCAVNSNRSAPVMPPAMLATTAGLRGIFNEPNSLR